MTKINDGKSLNEKRDRIYEPQYITNRDKTQLNFHIHIEWMRTRGGPKLLHMLPIKRLITFFFFLFFSFCEIMKSLNTGKAYTKILK